MALKRRLSWHSIWYPSQGRVSLISLLLISLSWLFQLISLLRRKIYCFGLLHSHKLPVPVIVIGNIAIGGTGKSPLVIWMVKFLQARGFKPGVISRGYGGSAKHWPQAVTATSDVSLVGDEAVMIAQNLDCPMMVGPDRFEAGKALLEANDCDMIVSDDGLQHYALQRSYEICVIDGQRRHGNGRCLPAGPLRESLARLRSVDAIVCNGAKQLGEFEMKLEPVKVRHVRGNEVTTLEQLKQEKIHAIAGIGNPDRFFNGLTALGLDIIKHPFADHHIYSFDDINFDEQRKVLMTEKDAVKCREFAEERHFYIAVEAILPDSFSQHLENSLFK